MYGEHMYEPRAVVQVQEPEVWKGMKCRKNCPVPDVAGRQELGGPECLQRIKTVHIHTTSTALRNSEDCCVTRGTSPPGTNLAISILMIYGVVQGYW